MAEHYEERTPRTEHHHEEPPREIVHEREVRELPVVQEPPVMERPPVHDSGPSWTSYALIKYGFILVMVVVILYFIAQFVLPLLP